MVFPNDYKKLFQKINHLIQLSYSKINQLKIV